MRILAMTILYACGKFTEISREAIVIFDNAGTKHLGRKVATTHSYAYENSLEICERAVAFDK